MLALLAKCDKLLMTIWAILSFFSFCKWGVRSSRATTAEMLPSRSRNSAFSSGMTNWRGTGPPRDLRTTTEFKFTLTEPLILELENEKYGLQSTIRQLPHSFRMIFLRRRQSMLETFMLKWAREMFAVGTCVFQGCRLPTEPCELCLSLHFLQGDSVRSVLYEWNLRRLTSRTIYGHGDTGARPHSVDWTRPRNGDRSEYWTSESSPHHRALSVTHCVMFLSFRFFFLLITLKIFKVCDDSEKKEQDTYIDFRHQNSEWHYGKSTLSTCPISVLHNPCTSNAIILHHQPSKLTTTTFRFLSAV